MSKKKAEVKETVEEIDTVAEATPVIEALEESKKPTPTREELAELVARIPSALERGAKAYQSAVEGLVMLEGLGTSTQDTTYDATVAEVFTRLDQAVSSFESGVRFLETV